MYPETNASIPARIRLWSLREDVLVESNPAGNQLLVYTPWGDIRIHNPSAVVRESLRRMTFGPVSLENVLARSPSPATAGPAGSGDPDPDHAYLVKVLDLLRGCVVHSLAVEDIGMPLISAVPVSQQADFQLPAIADTHPVRLSRFAAMRAVDEELILESPLSHHRVVLHRPPTAWVVGSLGSATTTAELAPALKVDRALAADIVSFLAAAGMLVFDPGKPEAGALPFTTPADARGNTTAPAGARGNITAPAGARGNITEDSDPRLIPWSHHDLMFHSRSRLGRYDGPVGAVFPHGDRLPPPPVVKPVPEGARYPLYRPVLADLAAHDLSLTEAIEGRRSFHRFDQRMLSARQLGELLYRAARIRSVRPGPEGEPTYLVSDRPYPSSDGLHELELYLTLDRCAGLPRGIYHYDPGAHALTLINTSEARIRELLETATAAARANQTPPALITMTARMARLSWMYSGIAYATALKHVGVLQQTLYLVATAMELAPCALGVGDSETATRAFGLDWPDEVSIGEFVIGGSLP